MSQYGFRLTGGNLEFFDGARTPYITSDRFVNFLPTEHVYAFSTTFPDVEKRRQNFWAWHTTYALGNYATQSWGVAAPGAVPQEWSDIIVIGAAPADSDIFFGRAQITRTVAPTHQWLGKTIFAPPIDSLWVPICGSMELERAVGFGRTLSIVIQGGNLVAKIQQSVGGPPNGYETWGPLDWGEPASGDGGGNEPDTLAGIPVWQPTASPGAKTSINYSSSMFGPPRWHLEYHRWASSTGDPRIDPPVYSDPTNYASTYSINLVGRFGRASGI